MINNTYTYLLICLAVLLTSCNDDVAKPNPVITPNITDVCAVYTWQSLEDDLTLDTIYARYGRLDSIYIDKDSFYVSPFVTNPSFTVIKIIVRENINSNDVVQHESSEITCDYEVDTVYVNYGENRINDFLYKENIPIDTAKLISFFDTIPISLGFCSSSPALEITGYSLKSKGLPDGIYVRSKVGPLCGVFADSLSGGGGYMACHLSINVCMDVIPQAPTIETYPSPIMISYNRLHMEEPSSTPTGIVKWELILVNRYGEEFILNMESVFVEVEGVPADPVIPTDPEIPPTLYN